MDPLATVILACLTMSYLVAFLGLFMATGFMSVKHFFNSS